MAASRLRVAAIVVAASALALVACDAILDLGQYHNDGQCSYGCDEAGYEASVAPPHDAAPETADSPTPFESGADGEGGSDGSADADATVITMPDSGWPVPTAHEIWAHWPMPNPDAALSDESSTALPNQMAYDAGADGGSAIAYDSVTGLSWWRQGLPASSYENAWEACLGLNSPGSAYTWRVPTRIELVSLIDFTQVPTIRIATFFDVGLPAWTSSAVAGDESYWLVDFSTGLVLSGGSGAVVICVSGGTP
jgi:hypothetical protein